ncbi:MAG: hypothetical protein RIG61_03720 [Deltaproteobacteria bacterium]
MLQDIISKIKYSLVLALMLVVPMQAFAGSSAFFEPIDQTDTGVDRLVNFYDTIGRSTFIQVTNTSDDFVDIHVQVWNASENCNEVDFFDLLTPGDTNIYDVENLPGNPSLSGTTGFVTVSAFSGPSGSIIGMFRVIDDSGYEYRTNAADTEFFDFDDFADYVLNFNDVNGNNLSDVVGLTYASIDSIQTFASPNLGTQFGESISFQNFIFDANEFPISCSPAIFACVEGGPTSLNKGIDNSIPNSQGYPRICNASILNEGNNAGWLLLPFITHVCTDPTVCDTTTGEFFFDVFFVGYLGLNNGNGTGSMDSWWGVSFELL